MTKRNAMIRIQGGEASGMALGWLATRESLAYIE